MGVGGGCSFKRDWEENGTLRGYMEGMNCLCVRTLLRGSAGYYACRLLEGEEVRDGDGLYNTIKLRTKVRHKISKGGERERELNRKIVLQPDTATRS